MAIQVPPDSTGKLVDTAVIGLVERQIAAVGDPTTLGAVAKVAAATPGATDYGLTVRQAPAGLQEALVNVASSGDHNIIAAVSGQVITIWKVLLWSGGDQQLSIRDGSTALMGPLDLAQGGQLKLDKDSDPWFTLSANSPFNLNTSQAVQLSGRVYYRQG